MNARGEVPESVLGLRRASRRSARPLALMMGFALISSGLVAGAASPALAEEPAGDLPVVEAVVPAEESMLAEDVADSVDDTALAEELATEPQIEVDVAKAPVVATDEAVAHGDGSWVDFPEPVVKGPLQYGQKLSATHAKVPSSTYPKYWYQWYRTDTKANGDMVAIPGATGLSYSLTRGDIGMAITFGLHLQESNGDRHAKFSIYKANIVDPAPFTFVAPKTSPFGDISKGNQFFAPISWMSEEKISTGVKASEGRRDYQPKIGVSREAMAAFLYRHQGSMFRGPKVSPFADVKPGDKFYDEIAWMQKSGLSTGIKQANGKPNYAPKDQVSREAMAAFVYRLENASLKAPAVSPFADIKPSDKFFKEIAWMQESGLSTGIKQPAGKPNYAPKSTVSREAMAAFLYRLEPK